ncbi:adaptin ear-binding coat-associated protein 2 [Cryptococcus wingfieldii CBS 7118]|uniref:Adaptin ear-binding coat-associated protein 2 n=1 Tax=Cryptococcus wingfieldii CBS 7118 TaxID=1295528 RepID=A0A1E3IM79_9TREE|nr:adaptin ear-binding coat-associated protein 2 [Cryptococcus wingfieldii CBS 7118]ODN89692.1 adaptin ear-binding coat-associated protein 2 [Cryptococcus wingfieldii CBS 7118]
MDTLTDEIEAVLFVAREVMVYQIPPQTTTAGHKAADWNVESFLWKGRLRVIDIGSRSELRLEDSSTGELFAQVVYVSPWNQVEPVLDSSRYFVLRVEGEGGKRAYIGMGFAERGEAFDFQVALQTVVKRTQNTTSISDDPEEPSKPAAPPKDYSLKEGQTFTINIPGRERKKPASSGGGGGGGLFALPPPPPPGRRG